jgi:hypothetical protein
LGLRFSSFTRYLIIDIDKSSRYRTPYHIKSIIGAFGKFGIYVAAYRSSNISNGIHLLATFDEAVQTRQLRAVAHWILSKANFIFADGQLECYPSLSHPKKAVRLPFQRGFVQLDEMLHPVDTTDLLSDRWKAMQHAFEFDCSAKSTIRDFKLPKGYIQQTKRRMQPVRKFKPELLSAEILDRYNRGKDLYLSGLLEPGSRHCALLDVGLYLYFYIPFGAGHLKERELALKTWIREKHNGQSSTWFTNVKQVYREIEAMVKWKPGSRKQDTPNHIFAEVNLEREKRSKAAIAGALPSLIDSGAIWKKNKGIRFVAVERATGLNYRTVAFHREYIERQVSLYQSISGSQNHSFAGGLSCRESSMVDSIGHTGCSA